MNDYLSTHASTATRQPEQNSRVETRILDLVTAEAVRRHPWLRMLGLGCFGLLGALLLFILTRLLVINHVQGELMDPLGRVVRRLDLSSGATKLVNYVTLICSASSLGMVIRGLCYFLLPMPSLRPSLKQSALLFGLLGLPLLAPDVGKKMYPVREVDPTTVAWFDESEDGSIEPHGLIGCVQEDSGGWWFCNVRGGPRPSDGSPIQPVTPAVHREWKQWLKEQADKAQEAERVSQAAAAAEQQRLQREADAEAKKQQQLKQQQEHAANERKAVLAQAEAVLEQARKERAAEEARLAEQNRLAEEARLEQARAEAKAAADRLAAQQAETERLAEQNRLAEEARRDQVKAEAQAAADRLAAQQEETKRQEEAAERANTARRDVSLRIQQERELEQTPTPRFTTPAEPPPQVIQLRQGAWNHINVHGDCVEVWTDGPVSLGADHFAPQTFPGGERHIRFNQGANVIHAMPAAYGTNRLFIRKLR
ncbi:MAG: hypothetical protein ACKVY0_15725 [Prosthecobacter sp.]|uniref:hypothetical protein n=1 Tax=Prosthecobacter sp. TaxID=1965333 RepID=UPI0039021307